MQCGPRLTNYKRILPAIRAEETQFTVIAAGTNQAFNHTEHDASRKTRLRLMSYNIQTGVRTEKYHHYITNSWKHVLPHPEREQNLDTIAQLVKDYDIVALQEVDAGSLRTGFMNQTQYIAEKAGFPYWHHVTNRNLGKIAQHSLGLISRLPLAEVNKYKLPGLIPGRGAMIIELDSAEDTVAIICAHLALGQRTRKKQLAYLHAVVAEYKHVILMGDLNCTSDSEEMSYLTDCMGLQPAIQGLFTFPSWNPDRSLDHILMSAGLTIENAKVVRHGCSDHLPVAIEVSLPESVNLVC